MDTGHILSLLEPMHGITQLLAVVAGGVDHKNISTRVLPIDQKARHASLVQLGMMRMCLQLQFFPAAARFEIKQGRRSKTKLAM